MYTIGILFALLTNYLVSSSQLDSNSDRLQSILECIACGDSKDGMGKLLQCVRKSPVVKLLDKCVTDVLRGDMVDDPPWKDLCQKDKRKKFTSCLSDPKAEIKSILDKSSLADLMQCILDVEKSHCENGDSGKRHLVKRNAGNVNQGQKKGRHSPTNPTVEDIPGFFDNTKHGQMLRDSKTGKIDILADSDEEMEQQEHSDHRRNPHEPEHHKHVQHEHSHHKTDQHKPDHHKHVQHEHSHHKTDQYKPRDHIHGKHGHFDHKTEQHKHTDPIHDLQEHAHHEHDQHGH